MFKISCYRTLFCNQRINVFQTLLQLAQHDYFHIFPWIRDILSWKKSSLVWSDIFRLFLNAITSDNKCSYGIMQKFAQQVQTPLCLKKKTFFGLLIAFLTYASNSKHFESKDEYPRLSITQIIYSERGSYLNV